jgi:hypothetical protein
MGKKDDPKVHRTRLMDLVNQAIFSKEFTQPFELSKDKLLKYWQQVEKPKSEKAYIIYNAESEDSSTVHSPEELTQRLIDALKNGKNDISILYNIPSIENGVKENLVIKDIELANQSALELQGKKRNEQLDKIEISINKQLIESPTNQYLLFERVVNRTYARDMDKALAYLQMAAKQALSSGVDAAVLTLKNKLELDGAIKLKRLKAERPPLFEAVLNGLTNNDIDLVAIEMGVLKSLKDGDDILYLKNTNHTYKNSFKNYTISTIGRDAEGNITLKVTVPEISGIVKDITPKNGQYLRYGDNLSGTYNGWTYYVLNDSPMNKNYIKLRIKFKYEAPLPTPDSGF